MSRSSSVQPPAGSPVQAARGDNNDDNQRVNLSTSDPTLRHALLLRCMCCEQEFVGDISDETQSTDSGDKPRPICDAAPYVLAPCGHIVCGACADATKHNGSRCVFGTCNIVVTIPDKPDAAFMEVVRSLRAAEAAELQQAAAPDGDFAVHSEAAGAAASSSSPGCTGAVLSSASAHCRSLVVLPVTEPDDLVSTLFASETLSELEDRDDDEGCGDITSLRAVLTQARHNFVSTSSCLSRNAAEVTARLTQLKHNKQSALETVKRAEDAMTQLVFSHCEQLVRDINDCTREREKQLKAQCEGLHINQMQCEAVATVLGAALDSHNPDLLDTAKTCSLNARGLLVTSFENPCASDYLNCAVADPVVLSDALSNLVTVRKVCYSSVTNSSSFDCLHAHTVQARQGYGDCSIVAFAVSMTCLSSPVLF